MTHMKKFLSLLMILPLGACSMFGHNAGVKEPPYKLLQQEKPFEVREYPSIVMATTMSEGGFGNSQNDSFQRLFGYISGKNEARTEITMTAPVLMKPEPVEIPMTAPVLMQNQGQGWSMSFVLPVEYRLDNAPKPLDSKVYLEEKKNVKFAVVKFSGLFSESNFKQNMQKLEEWMKKQNLTANGPALRAGYNPPWTIPALKRNEILVPVK